jgi:hypothetical protein
MQTQEPKTKVSPRLKAALGFMMIVGDSHKGPLITKENPFFKK